MKKAKAGGENYDGIISKGFPSPQVSKEILPHNDVDEEETSRHKEEQRSQRGSRRIRISRAAADPPSATQMEYGVDSDDAAVEEERRRKEERRSRKVSQAREGAVRNLLTQSRKSEARLSAGIINIDDFNDRGSTVMFSPAKKPGATKFAFGETE